MKIQLLSDTHTFEYDIAEEADVVVHAGDFSNNLNGCLEFAEYCKAEGKDYVFCLGNHDYYGSVLKDVVPYLKSLGLNVLHWDNSVEIKGYTFVGGTLFTNFRHNNYYEFEMNQFELNKQYAQNGIYDFIAIRSEVGKFITTDEYVTMFNQTYNNINKYRNKEKVVVVTHFPPHIECQDPAYNGSPLNPYFINNINVKGFKHWLCGHTHTAMDLVVDDCRIVVNPLGYPGEHDRNGFQPILILDV